MSQQFGFFKKLLNLLNIPLIQKIKKFNKLIYARERGGEGAIRSKLFFFNIII